MNQAFRFGCTFSFVAVGRCDTCTLQEQLDTSDVASTMIYLNVSRRRQVALSIH
jgi:hypothetical protein